MNTAPAGSFERISSLKALWHAWLHSRKGKRRQPRMASFELDADTELCKLHRLLRSDHYRPGPYSLSIVRDPKIRLIAAPDLPDRILQNAILMTIGPFYERSFIDHSYACCTGRGPHRAVLQYLKWTRRFRYRMDLDIRRYFASINHEILHGLFAHRLKDRKTLNLISMLLSAGGRVYQSPIAAKVPSLAKDPIPVGCGLPLGGYLSHWSGGLYLDGLDHYIKRTLKVKGYLRYMDDFTLFGDDRIFLEEAGEAIIEWLARERRLELKYPDARVLPTTQPVTFLGFRVSRSGLLVGPKAKRNLRARLRQVDGLGYERLVRGLRAYRGIFMSIG